MTAGHPTRPWDDPGWKERDPSWRAGCRWLQSWWRSEVLGVPPGERSARDPDRLVASMLPIGSDRSLNFLGPEILAAVDARLAEGNHSGIVGEDRLVRNLLSSQPTCFNLFGPFVERPAGLLPWVRSIDAEATSVAAVRFEWAPDRERHFGGGSAFDAFVTFGTDSGRRFLGVECKYAEHLPESSITVRPPYVDFTEDCGHWRPGASGRLDVPDLRQFWLNTLLGQSLAERDEGYAGGTVVVVACVADQSARSATERVRAELVQPDDWLRWSPYEDVLELVDGAGEWTTRFRRRYLDFGPVADLLPPGDPRRA